MDKAKIQAEADGFVERNLSAVERQLRSSGWLWEHWRDGKVIDTWYDGNICTDEGLNNALGVNFSAVTQITDWYVVIYNTDTTPIAGMTYLSPQFTETTAYSEANRPEWQDAGVSAKSITNSANKASFTMTTSETIYGAALVGGGSAASTKGDKAGGGVIYNVSAFTSGSKSVASSDILKVTLALTIADA